MRPEASARPGCSPPSRFPQRPSPSDRRKGGSALAAQAAAHPTRAPGRRSRDGDAARRDRALARMAQERDARRGRDPAVGADDLIERRRSSAVRGRTAVARVAGTTSAGHRPGGRHDRHGESAAGDAGGRVHRGGRPPRCGGLGGGATGRGAVWEGGPSARPSGGTGSRRYLVRLRSSRRVGEGARRLNEREHGRGAPLGHGDRTRR